MQQQHYTNPRDKTPDRRARTAEQREFTELLFSPLFIDKMTDNKNTPFKFAKPLSKVVPEGATRPSYDSMKVLQTELNENAMSVSRFGPLSHLGFLALTIPDNEYLLMSGNVPFIVPIAPAVAPVHLPGATGPTITETNRQYLQDQKEFTTYRDVEKALCAQLQEAVPQAFLQDLKHPVLRFANVTCLQMLQHLWRLYGKIDQDKMVANRKRIAIPWIFPQESLEVVINRMKETIDFSIAGGDPISNETAMTDGYMVIAANPGFERACYEWDIMPLVEKTMDGFKEHFRKHETYLLTTKQQGSTSTGVTAGDAGYSANQVHQIVIEAFQQMLGAATTPTQGAANLTVSPPPVDKTAPSYCWKHGIMPKGGHNSETCKSRNEPGHQIKATLNNKMGGCKELFVPFHLRAPKKEE